METGAYPVVNRGAPMEGAYPGVGEHNQPRPPVSSSLQEHAFTSQRNWFWLLSSRLLLQLYYQISSTPTESSEEGSLTNVMEWSVC